MFSCAVAVADSEEPIRKKVNANRVEGVANVESADQTMLLFFIRLTKKSYLKPDP